jgi:hypothetical protein
MPSLFRRAAASLTRRSPAEVGGAFYLGGDILQFSLGLVAWMMGSAFLGATQLACALTFALTGWMFKAHGRHNAWFAAASALCAPAMIGTNWTALMDGSMPALAGTGIYVAGVALGAVSAPLTHRFSESARALTRRTLGAPRPWMGALCLGSKAFLFADALARRDWGFLAVLGLWSGGDIAVGLSTAGTAKAKGSSPAP